MTELAKRSIAITGAQGQLGTALCQILGDAAVALDLPDFDLTDEAAVRETVTSLRPKIVINTAAYTLVDRAEEEPGICQNVNATGVAHLVAACREVDCTLVQISTDYVFFGSPPTPAGFREIDSPDPQGLYANSKLQGELHAAEWEKSIIVRTCGLYGERGANTAGANFVDTMIRLAKERTSLRIVSDQLCSPTYAPHLAKAILFLAQHQMFGLYHITNRGVTTWYDFAAEIFRLLDVPMELEPITTEAYGAAAPRPKQAALDTTQYHSLGAPAMPSWEEALREYINSRG